MAIALAGGDQHAHKPRSGYRAIGGWEADTCHLCARAIMTTRNAFRLEGLSKPEECPHGQAATIFWARGTDPFKDALGDLTGSEHSLRFGI